MKKIAILLIGSLIMSMTFLCGCNTSNEYKSNEYKVTLHEVTAYLYDRNYVELWFDLNINNYDGERLTLGSLNYTMRGNSLYFSGGEIKSFSDDNTTLQSAFTQFTDTISLYGKNPVLNNTVHNKQPVTWTVSGELTLYGKDNTPLLISFDALTYNMTEYD